MGKFQFHLSEFLEAYTMPKQKELDLGDNPIYLFWDGQDLDIYFEKSKVAVFIVIQLCYKVALEPQNSLICTL